MGNGREGERNCSGMRRGWNKSLENRCSQRHLAGSLLLHPQAMWPLAVWLGSDPRLSTHHELATVTCIQSRGQHMLGFRSSNAYNCPEADRESSLLTEFPLSGAFFPPSRLPNLLIFQSIQFNVTSSGRPSCGCTGHTSPSNHL